MIIILSQKVDTLSSYSDELFNSYHFPGRYRNQIHTGDIFVYYQGNRYDKSQRYYFGIGKIGEIYSADEENYYAKLTDCRCFEQKVPIYLPDGGYIEQLGYESVRKSITPPWQSSIRPLSQTAYDYIVNMAGKQAIPPAAIPSTIEGMNAKLKDAIRDYYVNRNVSAIYQIESLASAISRAVSKKVPEPEHLEAFIPSKSAASKMDELVDYCRTMKMSYSYKPLLILALLHSDCKDGKITIKEAAAYFRSFYEGRKNKGLPAEKKKCLYLHESFTDEQIMDNIISNPVKALTGTDFFYYDAETQNFYLSPVVFRELDRKRKMAITKACNQRLKEYFQD